jgi:eukaryotic-like serine/threonine-protein kinase
LGGAPRKRFGKYELVSRLGAGGMAETWRAELVAGAGVRKPVVIKRILPWRAQEPGFIEMFVQEAKLSAHLSHGNVAQVFDFGDVGGEYFIAMEFIDGLSLHEVIERADKAGFWHLPYPVAMLVAIDVCKGLHHAHTRAGPDGRPLGIVHRDISPDNLILSFEGDTKIVDFGVAKAAVAGRSETAPGLVKGKFTYFSPEQAVADPLDGRSDIYALGIVLYEMFCGATPFPGGQMDVMHAIAEGRYIPPLAANPELIPQLVAVLDRALAFERDDRFATALELQEALSDVLFRHTPKASNAWVKDFLAYLTQHPSAATLKPASQAMIEQWKPLPRSQLKSKRAAAPAASPASPALGDAADLPTQSMQARQPAPAKGRGGPWIAAFLGLFAVGAGITLFALTDADPTRMSKLPDATRVAPPAEPVPRPPPVDPPPPPKPPQGDGPAPVELRYSAAAPAQFVLEAHHRISVDAAANLGERPDRLDVVRWPKSQYPWSFKFLDPKPENGDDESREHPYFIATIGQGSLGIRFVESTDKWPGARHVLFSAWGRMPWNTFFTQGEVRLADGRFAIGGTSLLVDSSNRFSIDSFARAPAWKMVVVQKKPAAAMVPALFYALPARGSRTVVTLNGRPLNRDMAIVGPGTYVLAGAEFGWFTQPTITSLEPSSLEITLSEDTSWVPAATATAKPVPAGSGEMSFPCKSIVSATRVGRNGPLRVVLNSKVVLLFRERNTDLLNSEILALAEMFRLCRTDAGAVRVLRLVQLDRTREDLKAGLVSFSAEPKDVSFTH